MLRVKPIPFSSPCSPRPPPGAISLGDAGAADAGGAHLGEDLVQPLQGTVEVQLDPAGSAGHSLPPTRREGVGERERKNEHKCDLQNFTNVKRFYSYRSILSCLDNSLACGAKGMSLSSLTCSWPMLPASSTPDLFSLHLLSQRKNSLYDLFTPQISANRQHLTP